MTSGCDGFERGCVEEGVGRVLAEQGRVEALTLLFPRMKYDAQARAELIGLAWDRADATERPVAT